MYKHFFGFCLLLSVVTTLSSCDKSQETVAKDIPPAIQALIAQNSSCTCDPYIDQYEWKGQTVYVSSCKGPACLCSASFYDAAGNPLGEGQSLSLNTFRQEARFIGNVWSCTP